MQLMQARQICSIYHLLLSIGNTFLKTFRASVLPCIYAPERLCARTSVRTPVYATIVCALVQIVCLSNRVPVRLCVCGPVCPCLHAPVRLWAHAYVCAPVRTVCALVCLCARASVCTCVPVSVDLPRIFVSFHWLI